MNTDTTETVVTYTDGGQTYEIDHLGITHPHTQWGEFAVYCDGRQVAEFLIGDAFLVSEARSKELPPTDDLIDMARDAVRDQA